MDCNFLCSLPFRVWILILMYVCVEAAGGRIETKNKRVKRKKKGDRDNVTKSVCARSHKPKDKKKEIGK